MSGLITVLIGKSASGKTTILKELVKKGHKQIITYTTRPPRIGEKQGEAYNFISQEEFTKKIEDGFFAEYQSFDAEKGRWYYGSAKKDYIGDKIVILTPQGLVKIKHNLNDDIFCIYLFSNRATIKKRLQERKDNKEEVERRIKSDYIDFKNAEILADKIVYNNLNSPIKDIIEKIDLMVREKKNEIDT